MRAIVQPSSTPYHVSAVSSSAPAPDPPPVSPVPSGRLLLRMPPDLHAELTRAAEREGKSLNAYITGRLTDAVGWGDDKTEVDVPGRRDDSRLVPALLVANGVVIALAAIVSLAILLFAWLG